MSTKTVLITGATGLLGRQVVKAFERADWSVKGTGYSRADGVTILKVDLAKPDEVEAVLDKVKFVALPFCSKQMRAGVKRTRQTDSPPPDRPLLFTVRETCVETRNRRRSIALD